MPSLSRSPSSSIVRVSAVIYGSHSAPLMQMYSTFSGSTFSLTAVGKVAPPRPTTPLSRTAARKLSKSVTSGGVSPSQRVCAPSVSMTSTLQLPPWNRVVSSIFFTVPDTLAWMGAPKKPPASAIFCPT